MNDVPYDVHVLKTVTYHGTIQMRVPGGKISSDFEEGYARGSIEMAIAGGMFDEKSAEWDDRFDVEYEVVDASPADAMELQDQSPPVDAEVIPVETKKKR